MTELQSEIPKRAKLSWTSRAVIGFVVGALFIAALSAAAIELQVIAMNMRFEALAKKYNLTTSPRDAVYIGKLPRMHYANVFDSAVKGGLAGVLVGLSIYRGHFVQNLCGLPFALIMGALIFSFVYGYQMECTVWVGGEIGMMLQLREMKP